MRQGFVKVAAATPDIQVADCIHNADEIIRLIREMEKEGAKVMVFPELCITGYTCGDLFGQEILIRFAAEQLLRIVRETSDVDALIFVGLPFEHCGKLYNVAAACCHGEILGLVPKKNLPTYGEFYERRNFTPGPEGLELVSLDGEDVPFGSELLFTCANMPKLTVAAELCEDLWVAAPPSVRHAAAGANLIVNLSASSEAVGKSDYRRNLVTGQSARLVCGYVYANAGEGESTQDLVFGGQNLIAENGVLLASSRKFTNEVIYGDVDLERICGERRRCLPSSARWRLSADSFCLSVEETKLSRVFPRNPFVASECGRPGMSAAMRFSTFRQWD